MKTVKFNSAFLKNCSLGVNKYFTYLKPYLAYDDLQTSLSSISKGYLVYSSSNEILWSPGQVGSLLSSCHIVTCHDVIDFIFYKNLIKNRIKYKIHKYVYRRASMVIFISYSSRDDFKRVFDFLPKNHHVIQSGFPNINPLVKSECQKSSDCVLISNKLPHKNNKIFLEAFADNRIRETGLTPVVIGEMSDEFHARTRDLGVNVKFLNNLSDAELEYRLSHAKCLVSPSLIEGHNLPVSEAIAFGTQTIVSDIAVHREFYDGISDFFNPMDKNSLVESLLNLHQITSDAYIRSAYKTLRTWQNVGEEYREVFEELARDDESV